MKSFQTLKKNWEFQAIFKNGRSYSNSDLVLYVCPLSEKKSSTKVAFCAGKKLGSAVRRNRIKRQLRHAFFALKDRLKTGFALIIIARGKGEQSNYASFLASLEDLFTKAHLLRDEKG